MAQCVSGRVDETKKENSRNDAEEYTKCCMEVGINRGR